MIDLDFPRLAMEIWSKLYLDFEAYIKVGLIPFMNRLQLHQHMIVNHITTGMHIHLRKAASGAQGYGGSLRCQSIVVEVGENYSSCYIYIYIHDGNWIILHYGKLHQYQALEGERIISGFANCSHCNICTVPVKWSFGMRSCLWMQMMAVDNTARLMLTESLHLSGVATKR